MHEQAPLRQPLGNRAAEAYKHSQTQCNYKHTCPRLMMSLAMRNAVCTSDMEASLMVNSM